MYERVSQTFESLRRALGPGLSAKVTGDLAAFETYITEAFSNLDVQARAAAEANARAVDITERLSVLAKQLRTQNRQLKKQNRAIDAARTELELQSRAIAEATVDAVLEAEASQERVSELEQ